MARDIDEIIEQYSVLHDFDDARKTQLKAFALDVLKWWRE